MPSLQSLRHVSSAVHNAELLADEAEDLGESETARRLRDRALEIGVLLERALGCIDDVDPSRAGRLEAHAVLAAVYSDMTVAIQRVMPPEQALRLTPGGHLDVVERVRFRLRHLPVNGSEAVLDIRAHLERALFAYDTAVDAYLLACAEAQGLKERVIVESQALRIELERTKQRLLLRAKSGSDAWKRIKRRPVRTKRARWIDEARARSLLSAALQVPTAP